MLVPLPQAFAVDRGSIRGQASRWPDPATTPASDVDPCSSGSRAPSSAAEPAGTSSSGPSSEISPTITGSTSEAKLEYDDCTDDLGDLDDTACKPTDVSVSPAALDAAACELGTPGDEHHRRGRPCLRPRLFERRDLSRRQGLRRRPLPPARPVIAVPRLLLPLALLLACAHLVPPAAPQENGIPVVDAREKPLPEPVRLASARAHGGCDTGAQCVEHLDPDHSVADGQQVCEADGARWLTSACPHRGAHSACITEHFLVFDYGEPRAEKFGNPLHRDLVAAREACLAHSGEFYELTP